MTWTEPQIVVRAAQPQCMPEANKLAQLAGLAVGETNVSDKPAAKCDSTPWTLLVKPSELSLIRPDGLAIEIDFIRGKAIRRAQEANVKSQPLARALGLHKLRKRTNRQPSIIDATAGFGTDGWMMASLGCHVQLLEASPVLATMLSHALNKARDTRHAHNISVTNTNSVQYLNNEDNPRTDIIYLDPMYPQTRSKALVKKGMQLLHDLIGPDNNGTQLLSAALSKANYRVVVKRPRGAPQLAGSEHFTGQITDVRSPNTRFDIYHQSDFN